MNHSISRDPTISTAPADVKQRLRQGLLASRRAAMETDASAHAMPAASGSGSAPASVAMHAPATSTGIASMLGGRLLTLLDRLAVSRIAFYWPTQGEPDLREAIAQWLARDSTRVAALPVVIGANAPMVFHRWQPEAPMRSGKYGIAIPVDETIVQPSLLIVPCVGFDAGNYRLGYGGGFYDRTLAAMAEAGHRPTTIGIALDCTGIEALPVEAHDLPLDGILTEHRAQGLAADR